jgi:hypothetical protein
VSSTAVEQLKKLFHALDEYGKQEVLEFLYKGKVLVRKGLYMGPHPGLINEGLYCGPVPTSAQLPSACSACGRPW